MSVGRLLGPADIDRRGQPAVRVSNAEQVRVIVIGNQGNHWRPAFAVMQRKTAPTERMPRQHPLDTKRGL
jgi:hypothetical protein